MACRGEGHHVKRRAELALCDAANSAQFIGQEIVSMSPYTFFAVLSSIRVQYSPVSEACGKSGSLFCTHVEPNDYLPDAAHNKCRKW